MRPYPPQYNRLHAKPIASGKPILATPPFASLLKATIGPFEFHAVTGRSLFECKTATFGSGLVTTTNTNTFSPTNLWAPARLAILADYNLPPA